MHFSLGAHLASFISNQLAKKIGDRVKRITGTRVSSNIVQKQELMCSNMFFFA